MKVFIALCTDCCIDDTEGVGITTVIGAYVTYDAAFVACHEVLEERYELDATGDPDIASMSLEKYQKEMIDTMIFRIEEKEMKL